jgi:hypothetical protein
MNFPEDADRETALPLVDEFGFFTAADLVAKRPVGVARPEYPLPAGGSRLLIRSIPFCLGTGQHLD